MPDDQQPDPNSFPSLDQVQGVLASANADPVDAATAIRNWRNEAVRQTSQMMPDTPARWQATDKIDEAVGGALGEQRKRAIQDWSQGAFSPSEASSFDADMEDANGDPAKMSPQFQDRATQLQAIAGHPVFADTREERNLAPGTIKSGDTTLASFDYRHSSNGQTDVVIHPRGNGDENLPDMPLKVATPTDDEVKQARDAAIKNAADLKSKQSDIDLANATDPGGSPGVADITGEIRDATTKAHDLAGPHGKAVLTVDRIKEAVKSPEFAGKVGQTHLYDDFTKGVNDAVFQIGALGTRPYDAVTGSHATQNLSEAQHDLDTLGGSTRQDVTGGFADKNLVTAARGFGAMLPALAAGPIAKAAGVVSASSAIGASGVLMGLGAAGGSELQSEQRLSGLDAQRANAVNRRISSLASGDTEGAAQAQEEINSADAESRRVKSGRDVNALLTGGLMGGISKISPLHNLATTAPGFKSFALDVAKQSLEMPGLTVGNKLIDALTYSDKPELTAEELGSSALQGASMSFALGGLAKIHEKVTGAQSQVAANQQKTLELAKATGNDDPATIGMVQAIHAAQDQDVVNQGKQEAVEHLQKLQMAQNEVSDHQTKVDAIRAAPSVDQIPVEPAPGTDATPEEKRLSEIRSQEVQRRTLELRMNTIQMDESLSHNERQAEMGPLIKEKTKAEIDLAKLRAKLPEPQLSIETETSGDQSANPTTGANDHGEEKVDEGQQSAQGQESGGRRQEDGQDEVSARPAAAGTPGEPLPPRPSNQDAADAVAKWRTSRATATEASSPSGTPEQRPAEPAPEAPPAQTAASTENSQAPASVDPNRSKGAVKTVDTVPNGPDPGTALNHAQIDADRVRLGMEPIVKQAAQAFGDHIDRAARLGLEAARQTMRDLKANPRPHTTLEQAQMFLLKDHLERRLAEASDRFNNSEGDARDEATKDVRDARDQLQDLHEANYHSGSETALALGMRRYMLDQDEIPPLPVVLAKLAIAKGEPLTENEKAVEASQHKAAMEARANLEAHEDSQKDVVARQAINSFVDDVVAEMEKEIPGNLPEEKKAPNLRDVLKKKADEARERIRQRSGGVSFLGAKDLENLGDYAVIASSYLADVGGKVKDAIEKFAKEFPHLTKEMVAKIMGQAVSNDEKVNQRLAKTSKSAGDLKGLSPEGVIAKRRAEVKPGEIDPAIARELMKAHIRAGVTDVQDLTTKLTSSIQKLYPDAAEKDVRMAVTGLGKTSEPSTDPNVKKMADFRTQMALIENIRRLKEESLSPLKRGDQRQKASEQARALQRQLNEEMRKQGYSAGDKMDLRGRLDAIKSGLRNQIEDLEAIITGKRKFEAKGLKVERDAETKALEERRDLLKEHLRNMPEHKSALDAAETARSIDAAKASRDEYNRRVAEKDFESKRNPSAKVTDELRQMRAERDDAGQRYREMRASSDEGNAETLQKQIDAAQKAVDTKKQALLDNLPPNKKPEKVLASDPTLRGLQEDIVKLNKELTKQRYGDGMDALKKWAKDRKQELQDRLDGKPSEAGEKRPVPKGPEADAIRAEIKDLEKQVNAKEAPAKALRSLKDRIDKLQKKIDANDLSRKTVNPKPSSPEITDAQAKLDKLQDIYEAMQKADGTRDNESYRKRLDAQMARMQDNEAKGFPKTVRPVMALDAKSEAKRATVADFKRGFEQRRYNAEQAKRLGYEKAFDTATGVIRGFKLSRILTLAKLALFSGYKVGGGVIGEELSGYAASKIFRDLNNKATVEGTQSLGGTMRSIGAFYKGFFGHGMLDLGHAAKPILALLTTHIPESIIGADSRLRGDINAHSELKSNYEKFKPRSEHRWYDTPQILHEMEKAPLLRASYEMAKQKLVDNAKSTGRRVTPEEIGKEAFDQAKRAILMSDNLAHSVIQAGIRRADAPNKAGHVPFIGKAGSFALTSLATFTKVAANHFVLLFNNVAGLPTGAGRLLGHALAGSLADLPPETANSIMRQMKQGSPGMAMLLMGMAAPHLFGGMNVSKKRKDGDPGFGEIIVDGHKIPRTVSMSNPLLMAAQIGATITQTAHSKLRKKDKEEQGMGAGALAGIAGVAESGPLVNEASHLGDALKGEGLGKWVGNWLKGNLMPGLLDEIAQATDRANGTPVKRQTTGILDTLESAVPNVPFTNWPGLRQQLPVAKPKKR